MATPSNALQLPGGLSLNRLAGPVLILMILAMMILRLPPFLLDLLFTFNIALSIIVLLVSLYTTQPLQFSAFPTVLLITTLLRLSLNVASTRQVLLEGHTGADAAGKVIEAFGHFLVGGNYAVGIVVFIILIVIIIVVFVSLGVVWSFIVWSHWFFVVIIISTVSIFLFVRQFKREKALSEKKMNEAKEEKSEE